MARTPRVQEPSTGGLFDDEPTVVGSPLSSSGAMPPVENGIYPYDGRPVMLTDGDGHWFAAVWRKTRRMDFQKCCFVETAFWSHRNSGGRRVEFEPKGWKPFEEEPLYQPPPAA
jgi:hypothetical protein